MIWIYNFFLTLGSLVWVPWMFWRAKRRKEAVDWKERSGTYPFQLKKGQPRLWLHAVSVGEVVAAMPILKQVRSLAPSLEIVLSVTTSSGHQTAREKAEGLFDHLVYYPIDVYRFVLSGLVRVRPSVVAVMETELWMNFLDAAHHIDVRTLIVNGRISDRSFPRARTFRFFYRDLLTRVDRCLMQSETDADRMRTLGGKSVEVFGNCKFDQAAEGLEADPDQWRAELGIDGSRPVVVVGSTRGECEETLVLEAIKGLSAQVIWAPRHLERVQALKSNLEGHGFEVVLRSVGETLRSLPLDGPHVEGNTSSPLIEHVQRNSASGNSNVMILDTYGELSQVYSIADVVVIGGGFDNLGGQNLIQPLAHGKPVIHGPHMQNFRDVAESARHAGATLTVETASELRTALDRLLGDPVERAKMGEAARSLVQASLGASRRYAEAIVDASGLSVR